MSSSAPPPRWTRPAQFLVYLVPVGDIPPDVFASYARLLQRHSDLPLRSLTRPGGYAAELSPFRSLDWAGGGVLRFRFVSAAERVDACDGEDVQASRRVVGVLGVCHSPSLTLHGGLRAAYEQFEASVRRFPGLLLHKLFAFEHAFEDATAAECEGLADLVMFPVHHELQGTGESTVSLHLQVVMDTLAVNALMALESAIRSATASAAASTPRVGDLASVLLDVNVEPQQQQTQQSASSPLVLSRDVKADAAFTASPTSRATGPSLTSIPSPLAAGVAALDPRNRRRKRQLARREKLLGDYSVLVSCISDALDHYMVAVEMLREEERRSGGAPGDALWLAAALEGYVFCLYSEAQDKFSTELVEKASEAVALYAKAGTVELESLLIENLGWYYAAVAMATLRRASTSGEAKVLESLWTKRLLWDVLERGLMLFPELQPQRQVEFLIQTSRMLETVGHRRRVALFLHEAASLLLARNAPSVDSQLRLLLSPSSVTKGSQRQRDLEAALLLERMAAERLGIQGKNARRDALPWEVTTQYRRSRRKKAPAPDNCEDARRRVPRRNVLSSAAGDVSMVRFNCSSRRGPLVASYEKVGPRRWLGRTGTSFTGVSDSDSEGKSHLGVQAEPLAVWNLRSKTEIAKIERNLLNLLESDCTALRASEQVQLPTFLGVDKLKLRSSCNLQHPFLSRTTALGMFGAQSASNQQAAKSDFFYSPFEKQKMSRKAAQRGGDEEDDIDDAPAMYERGFPVHERVELQLTLSNPTGVAVKLQQVKAWVAFVEENSGSESTMNTTLKNGGVECYPSFLTLGPYERHKTVMLEIQPLRVGIFHVRGCFIKAFNITTSFTLKDSVSIRVVGELPMVSLSLREQGSMSLSKGEKAAATKSPPASKLRIAMFATETKRCMVRVRSTGNQQITNYRLAVNVQHRRGAKKTCVIFNNLPPASADTGDGSVHAPVNCNDNPRGSSGQVETQVLSLSCGKIVFSPLPLSSGDFVSIPFEILLRGTKNLGEPPEEDILIEWSFVYADEVSSGKVFYRESKLAMELVSLPSLMLRSVALLPCSVEQIPPIQKTDGLDNDPAQAPTTDHLFCAIMVHVANPTETTFRFRQRRGIDASGEVTCEAEIGRQCSRRFVVEVPRLPSLGGEQGSTKLADMLNDLLEMGWETYFGTHGRLRCEEYHLGPITEQEQMARELLLPPISLQIHSPTEVSASDKAQNGDISAMKQEKQGRSALHPLNFFQATHLRAESRTLHVELFNYVPIKITIQRAFNDGEQQFSGVEVEIIITEEGEEKLCGVSEHVVVVGLLKTQVMWSGPMEEAAKIHEVQCMFLSEGNFRVTVCGRLLAADKKRVGGEIWSHQPMHVCVRSEDATDAEKTANII
ncbi:hypothetical protein PF002_g8847 [Phytophthora fragariae]|uniref:Trs120/TRAPPC9 N-terminal domain-containing protein n=2 Tax=Phytophthora fragariae TaxID=53985 RepID=A0A6A3F5N7_9STRA|nr:hypothetical protein PF003_g40573 [Phytophthora fragariae]KAE8940752.1 hypothetical protein PF009_g9451 [Phytophthora fragariae]KAE9242256.1 hypothetical protein PF002_g8847 [Phytophthora fragariae]KAE9315266.1 hypothetical protein PF001_g7886 [Phytophthora fragariae]